MKAVKAFMKPLEEPQRSVKTNIKVNFHFNKTLKCAGQERLITRGEKKKSHNMEVKYGSGLK